MKKLKYLLLILFLFPLSVYADNIYSKNMDIYLTKEGNANVKEVWDVKASEGSEWYILFSDLGNVNITNYKVLMDNEELTLINNWDTSLNINQKNKKYGINYLENGLELCFGKSDYKRHTFTITYDINNIIFNVSDAQVLYSTLIPKGVVDYANIKITSYYSFPNDLDVWGYDFKGYATSHDGYVEFTAEEGLNNTSIKGLIKFPLNTFNINNSYSEYSTFNDVLERAEEGTFDYDYDNNNETTVFQDIMMLILVLFISFLPILARLLKKKKSVYINNKKIPKEVNYFRNIPCDNDIKKAYYLAYNNNLMKRNTDLLGCFLLKWIKEGIIVINKEGKNNIIIFNEENKPNDELELELYNMMCDASNNGILKSDDFKKYCKDNYKEVFNYFDKVSLKEEIILIDKGLINVVKKRKILFNKKYKILNDELYNEVISLKGLKKYFKDFTRMYEKMPIEVHLWQEYLIFAQLFGMADKVAKEFKDLYPEVITDDLYDDIIFMNMMYSSAISSASTARINAETYSAGGGGFSSGGGGGGSFGGGGSSGGR